MRHKIATIIGIVTILALVCAPGVMAKVTAEEAAKLKTTLTPFGAERAGNADGTIPAWDGGIKAPPPELGWKGPGNRYPDPYADDKVLFSITSQNVDQHEDKLNHGQIAMLKKYPTYRLDVYPTHRSFAAPDWVYENTFKNATRAEASTDGLMLSNAFGGIAFPIPKTPQEVMWNHLTRWNGESTFRPYKSVSVSPNGKFSYGGGGKAWELTPYYKKNGSLETFKGEYFMILSLNSFPARKKGEFTVVRDPINMFKFKRKAWQYLVGQRRVRRAPMIGYDTPSDQFSGELTYDEVFLYNGSMDRYTWKLVGKKEMYIAYNTYKADKRTDDLSELYPAHHVNPDYMRWELHRVWVVEATLAEGKRHIYAKRYFYLDEDSWIVALADQYDARESLWRTSFAPMINVYDVPAIIQRQKVYFDLLKEGYAVNDCQNMFDNIVRFDQPQPESFYTPEQIRRMAKR